MTDIEAQKISVVGLGKLGLSLAACFAKRGVAVLGVDSDPEIVEAVNNGHSPILEPGLGELIAQHGGRDLLATTRHRDAIETTDTTFVLVGTRTSDNGPFSAEFVESALRSLGAALADSTKRFHHFVVCSTVMPGTMHGTLIPLLESVSGRHHESGFAASLNPEFVALGNVVAGFLDPKYVVIGESSATAGRHVENIVSQLWSTRPNIFHMSLTSAELVKLSVNAFLAVKIGFANTLSNICEGLPDTDLDAVTSAIGADPRVGSGFFLGGIGYGGPCLPRDTSAFIALASELATQAEIVRAAAIVNDFQDQHLARVVRDAIAATGDRRLGVLGLSFKPNTPVVTDSPAVRLIAAMLASDVTVTVFDPLAMEVAKKHFGDLVIYAKSASECVLSASVSVITTQWPGWVESIENLRPPKPTIIVDCWRLLNPSNLSSRYTLTALGRGIAGR